MPTTEHVFLALLRSELTSEPPMATEPTEALVALAAKHDLAHLVADALDKQGALGDDAISVKLKKYRYLAVFRYEQIRYTLDEISACFAEAAIPFIPLKGAVLRERYPEPWMRTSGDIDVLVHPEDVSRATKLLVETLGYRCEGEGSHDISLYAPCGLHVELHFSMVEDGRVANAAAVLSTVWEHCDSEHRMSDAMFYFYHVAHMAKHIATGGCGVRSFVDLWLLTHATDADKAGRARLIQAGGLSVFEERAIKLAEVWFSKARADRVSTVLEEFIFSGGAFGTVASNAAMHHQKGRLAQVLSAAVLPLRALKIQYPILEKHAWLYPFCSVHRIVAKVFGKERKKTEYRLKQLSSVGKEERQSAALLLSELGLSDI